MFKRHQNEDAMLDLTQTRLMTEMDEFGPGTPEYATYLTQLEQVFALKALTGRKAIDPNTWVAVGGTFATAALIALIETRHVWPNAAGKLVSAIKK